MDKRRIDAIYSELLELAPEHRGERLSTLCEGDAELRSEVQSLLDAAERPLPGMDAQFDGIRNDYWRDVVGHEHDGDEEDLAGQRVDIWQLEERVGRGGLATVYRAQRADGEFSQRAAFKIMRRGLDTEDLIARFRAEREILAGLEHQGIAGILDGGALADGRPYLVLEFVDGISITDYCEDNALSLRDRLGLLREVAEALHHAHQRLVVHRDVKPSNVMVNHDGTVRLLDFGIAKILDPTTSPVAARLTRTGISVLTPAYASPEQVAGLPVTTGSDIYQLGLLMAEVLTGAAPDVVRGAAPTPYLKDIADRDLVAIVQKATRPEVMGRYGSAADFVADIDRYLSSRPVLARPDSWAYRVGKFARRRPLVLPMAAAFLVLVAAYIVTITSYSREVERERAIAEKTQEFMIGLFQSPDPRAPADPERGRSITVVEALDIGQARILPDLADQPELQASLSRAISSVYAGLDQYAPAIALRELALRLEESLYGVDSPLALESMRVLARLNREAGHMARASALTQRQLAIVRSMSSPGAQLGLAEHAAGLHAVELGEDDEAAELLERAIDDLLTQQGIEGRVDADQLREIIQQAAAEGNTAEAVRKAEALVLASLGDGAVQGLIARSQAAASLAQLGEFAAAEARYLEVIPLLQQALGERHPDVLNTRNNLGILYSGWQRHAAAEEIHAELLEVNREVVGPVSRAVGNSYQNLATVIGRQGRIEEAIDLHEQAFNVYSQVFDDSHITALPLLSKAYLELARDAAAAERTANQALERLQRAMPDSHLVGIAQCLLGKSLEQRGETLGPAWFVDARALMSKGSVPRAYAELCGIAARR